MKRGKNETIENFAKRLYYMQMEIYSSYAGRDLDQDFDTLPDDIKNKWLDSAENFYDREGEKS